MNIFILVVQAPIALTVAVVHENPKKPGTEKVTNVTYKIFDPWWREITSTASNRSWAPWEPRTFRHLCLPKTFWCRHFCRRTNVSGIDSTLQLFVNNYLSMIHSQLDPHPGCKIFIMPGIILIVTHIRTIVWRIHILHLYTDSKFIIVAMTEWIYK